MSRALAVPVEVLPPWLAELVARTDALDTTRCRDRVGDVAGARPPLTPVGARR